MDQTSRRRPGRPQQSVLSRQLIIDEAIGLLESQQTDEVSLADVARKLGVRSSALYNHVSSKDDLYSGIREAIGARVDLNVFVDLPWDEALREWTLASSRAYTMHPASFAAMAALDIDAESFINELMEVAVGNLQRAGWPAGEALGALWTLISVTMGHIQDRTPEQNPDQNPGSALTSPFARGFAERMEAAESLAHIGDSDAALRQLNLETSVDTVIRGLRVRHAELVGQLTAEAARLS